MADISCKQKLICLQLWKSQCWLKAPGFLIFEVYVLQQSLQLMKVLIFCSFKSLLCGSLQTCVVPSPLCNYLFGFYQTYLYYNFHWNTLTLQPITTKSTSSKKMISHIGYIFLVWYKILKRRHFYHFTFLGFPFILIFGVI